MDREISPPPLKRRRVVQKDVAMHQETSPGSLRLFSWNVNGISPFVQQSITSFFTPNTTTTNVTASGSLEPSLRGFLRRHNFPTFLFLQEIKINPTDSATQNALSRAIKRSPSEPETNPDYVCHFCLPHDKHNATGFGRKVYGVCSIVRKDFVDSHGVRMRTVDWDAEGRFSVIETKAELDVPKLVIFNVYMVNGTDYPYRDSATGEVVGTRHERKLEVHRLLQAEIRRLENDGFHVIVAGDINIARAPIDGHPNLRTQPRQHVLNRQDFSRRFLDDSSDDQAKNSNGNDSRSLGMIDTFRHLHPQKKGYSYYPRGRAFGDSCDRVDMVLCSRSLASNCVEASMLATAADRGTSDHVPIYATFDFGREPSNPSNSRRESRSSQGS